IARRSLGQRNCCRARGGRGGGGDPASDRLLRAADLEATGVDVGNSGLLFHRGNRRNVRPDRARFRAPSSPRRRTDVDLARGNRRDCVADLIDDGCWTGPAVFEQAARLQTQIRDVSRRMVVTFFGLCAVPAILALELHARHILPGNYDQLIRLVAAVLILITAALGLLLATYTGVLQSQRCRDSGVVSPS